MQKLQDICRTRDEKRIIICNRLSRKSKQFLIKNHFLKNSVFQVFFACLLTI